MMKHRGELEKSGISGVKIRSSENWEELNFWESGVKEERSGRL